MKKRTEKYIIKQYSKKKNEPFFLNDEDISNELRDSKLIEIVDIGRNLYKITDDGIEFCEKSVKKNNDELAKKIKDYIAIIISIISLIISALTLYCQYNDTKISRDSIQTTKESCEVQNMIESKTIKCYFVEKK